MGKDNDSILVALGIIGLLIGGPYLMSIYFPTPSCDLSPNDGLAGVKTCSVNILVPAGKMMDTLAINKLDVTATTKVSDWSGWTSITLPAPTETIGSQDITYKPNTCNVCSGAPERRFTYSLVSFLPTDYNSWELQSTSTINFRLDATSTCAASNRYDGGAIKFTDFPATPATNYATMYDRVFDDRGTCEDLNGGSTPCYDIVNGATQSHTKSGTNPTTTFQLRADGDACEYGGITSFSQSQSSTTIRTKRNLLPSDTTLKINAVSVGSKSGAIGAGFQTNDIGTNINTYCNRPTNTAACTVPLNVEATGGGTVNMVEVGGSLVVKDIPAGPVCPNNIKEGTEICDGTDLAGQTCISQGFTGGTLSCNAGCSAFVTTSCTGPPAQTCPNNAREGTEICDGTDLVGQTCISKGFTGGTLSCAADCNSFVTSACTSSPPPSGGGGGSSSSTPVAQPISNVPTITAGEAKVFGLPVKVVVTVSLAGLALLLLFSKKRKR